METTINHCAKCIPASRLLVILTLVLAALAGPLPVRASAVHCYVNAGVVGGTHDGTSWLNAFDDLQDALVYPSPYCLEFWVAAGVYKPGPEYNDHFVIEPHHALYGGFAGNETLREQRNWTTHVTILSGDIGGDDDHNNEDGNYIDETTDDILGTNNWNVVAISSLGLGTITSTTVLDGFTITGGSFPSGSGAGLYCTGNNAGNECSPTLENLVFSGNYAGWAGGALFNAGFEGGASSPRLKNVTFTFNKAGINGGAIYNAGYSDGTSSPRLEQVTFVGNSATTGGAIYNNGGSTGVSSPTLANVTFNANSASGNGGAIYNDGHAGGASSPVLANVTFSGNSAVSGGAIFNYGYNSGTANASLTNVILWGDSSSGFGPEMWNVDGVPSISYSVVQGGCAAILDAACGTGNLTTDPKLGALANNGGYTETMALLFGSSALNTGSDAACAAEPVNGIDQRGIARPQDSHCDIGAYELEQHNVDVNIGLSLAGRHYILPGHGGQRSYAGVNNGPARVINTDTGMVVSSVRVLYGASSYSEMMGYPNSTTSQFWFPWYNNTAMDSQLRVSNLGAAPTLITVTLAGTPIDSFSLGAGAALRKNYAGQNNGPIRVTSGSGVPILATVRVLYGGSSFSEMMGYPNNSTTGFWFPWYNNTAMDSQLRVSNVGVATTTITVYLAGSQIDSFDLGAGVAIRKNYAGQNSGPMRVTSSDGVPILSTIRVLWGTSLSEMMGYPNDATTDFWFPWYDNVGTDAQLRVGNLGGSTTTVTVHLDGSQIDSFDLGASAGIRKNYPGLNSGALHVTSSGGVPILSTLRLLYAGTSFYELMGYPASALTGTQYFPWYNNTAMDSQMRIAVP